MADHAGDPRFLAALEEIRVMHLKKGADYGAGEDTFANVRAAEQFGIPGWLGAVLRGNDKMARLKSFAIKKKLENESVEDSLLDLANYAIIALVLYREKRQDVVAKSPRPTGVVWHFHSATNRSLCGPVPEGDCTTNLIDNVNCHECRVKLGVMCDTAKT